jgi:hypothetical protein
MAGKAGQAAAAILSVLGPLRGNITTICAPAQFLIGMTANFSVTCAWAQLLSDEVGQAAQTRSRPARLAM